jgi:glyoxylase-like metal-dependent hydrolase (beta-lactamase superfamily II)
MTARLDVLCAGYAAERVASTVVLIRDEGTVIIVDPGMVADRSRILGPLARFGEDQSLLERSRAKLLAATPALIAPGHGELFAPGELA